MAEDNIIPDHVQVSPLGIGQRLKAARENAGYSLAQMADRTKIPARMLQLIEAGDFAALPARTYATGFTRSYARSLGLDENECVAAVRAELGLHDHSEVRVVQAFEPGDPNRVPSARFAWLAAVAALVVLAIGLVLWRTLFTPAVSLPPLQPEPAASEVAPAAAPRTVPPAAVVPVPASAILPAPAGTSAAVPAVSGTAAAKPSARPVPRPVPAPVVPEAAPSSEGPSPQSTSTASQ